MDTSHSTIHPSCSRGTICRQCFARTLIACGYDAEAYDREVLRHRNTMSVRRHRQKHPDKRKVYDNNPLSVEKSSNRKRLHSYGLTAQEYEVMLALQRERCLLCHKPETARSKFGRIKALHVDHNHTTGKVRALLCQRCNRILGMMEAQGLSWIYRALAYLS